VRVKSIGLTAPGAENRDGLADKGAMAKKHPDRLRRHGRPVMDEATATTAQARPWAHHARPDEMVDLAGGFFFC